MREEGAWSQGVRTRTAHENFSNPVVPRYTKDVPGSTSTFTPHRVLLFNSPSKTNLCISTRIHHGKLEFLVSKGGHEEPVDDSEIRHMGNIRGEYCMHQKEAGFTEQQDSQSSRTRKRIRGRLNDHEWKITDS